MKKIILSLFMICLVSHSQAQSFSFNVPNTYFQLEYGAGVDTKAVIIFTETSQDPVILSAMVPSGIIAVFQPDTVYQDATVVLSLMVKDSTLSGPFTLTLSARDVSQEITKTLHLQVLQNGSDLFPEYPAITYRDIAFNYLQSIHPELISTYGNLTTFNWNGFWQYPPLWVVSNYVFLTNNWRCNVLWHIMIPPYNWKKIFVYNDIENVCLGVNIDTDGNCSEIPCEKFYYFYQDSIAMGQEAMVHDINALLLYPNPAGDYTTLRFHNPGNTKHSVVIYSALSGLIKEIPDFTGEELRIDVKDWKPGIYIVRLEGSAGVLRYGKFIKY